MITFNAAKVTISLLLLLLIHPLSHAVTRVVTNLDDSGAGSLRETVGLSNSNDNIVFDASLSGGTITLTTGPIAIGDRRILGDLLVNAPVTINGNGNSNIFTNPHWAVITHVKGLRLTNGNSTWGGAILNQGNILVEDCVIDNCTASVGGAIYSEVAIGQTNSPQLTIVDCVLAGNTTSNEGAAIYARYSGFSATNCTIQGNKGALALSGACFFFHPISAPIFRNCIVWNNLSDNSTANASIWNLQGPTFYPTSYNYCLIENLAPGGTNLDGTNPANDPLFKAPIAPSSAPSAAGNLTPSLISPVVDAGLNSYNTSPVDALWNSRTHNTTIDLGAIEQQGNLIYVRSSVSGGNADGSSWADAYPHLQSALAAAQPGDRIHVAAGTYYPDEGTGQTNNLITSTFQLKSGVEIYGGFPAAGGTWSQRDFNTLTTTLSGDIDGNGTPINNAYHVVTGTGTANTALLDGFTITAGYAVFRTTTPGSHHHVGGGITCDTSGDAIFRNLIVSNNLAIAAGGGCYLNQASPTFINVVFSANQVNGTTGFREGGGVYNAVSSPTFINCLFTGNASTSGGGGIANRGSSPNLINCTISANRATGQGGGMVSGLGNATNSHPTLSNCIIWLNQAAGSTLSTSASVYTHSGSSTSLSYCLVANSGGSTSWNSAIGIDGGNNIDQDPQFTTPNIPSEAPSTFGDFIPLSTSGALNAGNNASNTEATDIAGNTRIQDTLIDLGAYESSANIGNPSVTGFFNDGNSTTTSIEFSVFFSEVVTHFNDASDFTISTTGNLAYTGLSITSINGSGASYKVDLTGVSGEGSLSITIRNDSDIQDTTGSGLLASSTANFVRLSTTSPIHYVRAGNPGAAAPYTTWATAAAGLQEALALANVNDAVHVAAGTYYPTSGSDRSISFHLKRFVSILGGFPAAGGTLSERYPSKHTTTLSGDLNQDDNFPSANLGDNSYHVVTANNVRSTAILDGFTISGGNATDSASTDTRRGGGIYCLSSRPTIINCIFQSNLADFGGGAAVYNSPEASFQKCQFRGNEAYHEGGAVINHVNSNVTYTNCLFSGNKSQEGGAIRNHSASPVFTNCTIANNSSIQRGAAFFNESTSRPTLFNSLIYGNEAGDIGDGNDGVIYNTTNQSYNTYTNTMCEMLGDNDINASGVAFFDPQFISPVLTSNNPTFAGDYRLSVSSPARNFVSGNTPNEDIRCYARNDGQIDLGAYEYSPAVINTHIDELNSPIGATTSLREAITHFPPFDGIMIDPSLAGQTITLTLGELVPNQNIDLDASSLNAPVTIDANGQTTDHRVLSIPSGITAAFTNFVFTGGKTPRGTSPWVDALPGGSIHNLGTLTLNSCTISNNHTGMGGDDVPGEAGAASKGGHGGGIYNAGTLTITQCNIINNSTGSGGDARALNGYGYDGGDGGSGGGIYNAGTLTMNCSSVVGNATGNGGQSGDLAIAGDGGHGGGICNQFTLVAHNVTMHGNSTGNGGPSSPTGSFQGGNGGNGGGFYLGDNSNTITQCTITENSAGNGGSGPAGSGQGGNGGGVYASTVAVHTIRNILAANNNTTGFGPDVYQFISWIVAPQGVNLLSDLSGSSLSAGPNIIVHADPMLRPLNDYGGPTLIRLPQAGSPAIDPAGGDTTSTLGEDQRKMTRVHNNIVDIGAIEHQSTGPELGFLWNTDLDNDGMAFGIEYGFNKNPDVADTYLGDPIFSVNPSTKALSFSTPNPALPFVAYQVSRSTDLITFTPLFNTIGLDIFNLPAGLTLVPGTNSFDFTYTDPNAPNDKAFYRVETIYVAP